jgi:ATP-dependent Clp protease, protease subunit
MSKHILDIDGMIGGWGYSKRLVRNFLADAGKNPVEIRISSLGGEIDHAIDIHNQFSQHGNVTAVFSGFNASSATLIGLGAKSSKIADNSFYLIHKALIWVDEWGSMNADDIDQVIVRLEKEKKELEKITLVLAKMYVQKTGKPLGEILDLMKKESWLTADEAVDMGFVDEVFKPSGPVDPVQAQKITSFLNFSDLPPLPVKNAQGSEIIDAGEQTEDSSENLFSRVKNFAQKIINSQFKMKKFTALLAVLSLDTLDSNDEQGVFLNEQQLDLIDQALNGTKQEELARRTAETNLATATANLALFDAIDPTIAKAEKAEDKVQAIRNYMASKPAVQPVGVLSTTDSNPSVDGVNWELLNSLPHMQEEVE